jgi:glycosyltransferase involved in cell wall biosynthesis
LVPFNIILWSQRMSKLSPALVKLRALVGLLLAKFAVLRAVIGGLRIRNHQPIDVKNQKVGTVLSFFGQHNGISAGALWQIEAFGAAGLTALPLDATPAIRNPLFRLPPTAGRDAAYVVIHTDGQRVAIAINALPRAMRTSLRAGYCAWELPDPPLSWGRFDQFLHEVWTPSEFSRKALQLMCDKPVRVVRHVVRAPTDVSGQSMRQRLKLRDSDFVVLAMADVRSSLARKNPLGAIAAFKQAIGMHANAVLILKVTGANHDPVAFDTLSDVLQGIRVVLLLDRLSMNEQWELYAACDVFISLHRAEGYGLPMAEAMAMGRPVVATGWSGNLDFMHTKNAALVDYKLVPIYDPQGVYSGSNWAEPSLEHAAHWLDRLYASPLLRADMGGAAAMSMAFSSQMAEFSAQIGLNA